MNIGIRIYSNPTAKCITQALGVVELANTYAEGAVIRIAAPFVLHAGLIHEYYIFIKREINLMKF